MLNSFEPVVNHETTTLIIGTMPGVASLNAQEYYANKRNVFWTLVFDILGEPQTERTYSERLQVLLRHHIGLWDSLAACERDGSLDSNIRKEIPNDFPSLFLQYPSINRLLFNGQSSYRFFVQAYGVPKAMEYHVLPSSSPANAMKNYAEKKLLWQKALDKKTLL
ncbi:MAG: DNA-deoxyinosine glycosylase [Bacteroidales bacterium]|nr:DNA-deoxyinosine glycosylase [Bacteroidales bacterium]MDD4823025.1 DNA-deoxyinosine glycosylase [Bacteroidales bacterium]